MNYNELLPAWNKELLYATPEKIIGFSLKNIKGPMVFANSFSVEDQMLMTLLLQHTNQIEIFTLDTGRLPQETYDTIAASEKHFGIKIRIVFPEAEAVEEMVKSHGINLFYDSIENRKLCCKIRKTDPLQKVLKGKTAWFTGLRREQSITRINIPYIDFDQSNNMLKISPLADLSEQDVWNFIRQNDIPYNPLQGKGYRSLGCLPCTRAVGTDDDFRAGRWWWEAPENKECGLHVNK